MDISSVAHQGTEYLDDAEETAVKHAVYVVHLKNEILALGISAEVQATALEEEVTFRRIETASGFMSTVDWETLSDETQSDLKDTIRQEILSSTPFTDHETGE